MKVWVFVEGPSDRIGLEALWASWRAGMAPSGWGIQVVPLDNKNLYFRRIGPRAAEKLVAGPGDLVVGLPDLYPNKPYTGTEFGHSNDAELRAVQVRLVRTALIDRFGVQRQAADGYLSRFHAGAFKHDFEMLLLAAKEALRDVLGTPEALGKWKHPVEDQNQDKPPKRVVEELFRTKKRRRYRDTVDAKAILDRAGGLRHVILDGHNHVQCPVFKAAVDWIGERTGVPGY